LRENPKTKPPPDFSSGGSLAKRAYFLQQAPALQQAPGQQPDERDVFASAEPSNAIAATGASRVACPVAAFVLRGVSNRYPLPGPLRSQLSD